MVISSVERDDLNQKDTVGVFLNDDSQVSSLVEYVGTTSDSPSDAPWTVLDPKKSNLLYENKTGYKLFAFTPCESLFTLSTPKKMMPTPYVGENVVDNDFCYTYAKDGIGYDKPTVSLVFKHLYSRISLIIYDGGDYVGDGKLTEVKLYGPGISAGAEADFSNFADVIIGKKIATSEDHPLTFPLVADLANGTSNTSYLMIPAPATSFTGVTNLSLTIDGTSLFLAGGISATEEGKSLSKLIAGNNCQIVVRVTKDGLEITGVSENLDW